MSVKIFDTMTTATPNFPLAYAEKINIVKEDGSEADIQTLYNNGELGGGDTSLTLTESEYLALPEEQKLNNSYYLYDIGVHYKNGVAYSRKKPIQLTMEEYKALKEAGAIDEQQEYLIEAGADGILLGAEDIGYNNAVSNLPCTTVQGAIDYNSGRITTLETEVKESIEGLNGNLNSTNLQTLQSANSNGVIEDALLVNLKNAYGIHNRPWVVTAELTTKNMPTDCLWGVRETMFVKENMIVVRITGLKTDTSQSAVWINCYNNDGWTGWITIA